MSHLFSYDIRSLGAVHCNVILIDDDEAAGDFVIQNRSVTFASALRRKPNAFNLLHQMKLMARTPNCRGTEASLWFENMQPVMTVSRKCPK